MNMQQLFWWGCSESYRGSGRPSRIWAQATDSADVLPDDEDENGDRAYPFNGMGGTVECGPFATEQAAEAAVSAMIETSDSGMLHWRDNADGSHEFAHLGAR